MLEVAALIAACAPAAPALTMQAVVAGESGAHPYAIGVNVEPRKAYYPSTRDEAAAIVRDLMARGISFDAGIAQVWRGNFGRLGLDAESVFDPCRNLAAAAEVLTECYGRAAKRYGEGQPAVRAALSCYNTGHFERGIANGYVMRIAQRMPELQPSDQPAAKEAPIRLKRASPEPGPSKHPFGQSNPAAFGIPEPNASENDSNRSASEADRAGEHR